MANCSECVYFECVKEQHLGKESNWYCNCYDKYLSSTNGKCSAFKSTDE